MMQKLMRYGISLSEPQIVNAANQVEIVPTGS